MNNNNSRKKNRTNFVNFIFNFHSLLFQHLTRQFNCKISGIFFSLSHFMMMMMMILLKEFQFFTVLFEFSFFVERMRIELKKWRQQRKKNQLVSYLLLYLVFVYLCICVIIVVWVKKKNFFFHFFGKKKKKTNFTTENDSSI